MPLLLTDWLTICTAGPTVDGRNIPENWLTEAAETYDRKEYPAFLNCEHLWGNLGTVHELRTNRDDKKRLILEARIQPNKYFLQQNAEGLRPCYSAEFLPNFLGSGKRYLCGLATSDLPACVGTTETHFSANVKDVFRGDPVKFENLELKQEKEPGIYEAVKDALTEIFSINKKQKQEQDEMTKDEFSEVMNPVVEKLNAVSGKLDDLAKRQTATPENKSAQTDHRADTFNVPDAFSKLTAAVDALSAKLDSLLKDVPPKGNPNGTGDANENNDLI